MQGREESYLRYLREEISLVSHLIAAKCNGSLSAVFGLRFSIYLSLFPYTTIGTGSTRLPTTTTTSCIAADSAASGGRTAGSAESAEIPGIPRR